MTAGKRATMPSDSRAFVSSFARGLKVIESFGPDNRTMTVAEVAERTGVDRAVARRLLLTLRDLGFVHVHERRFELTTHVLRLAYSFLSSAGLGASLQPFLDDLARGLKETVSISVLDETEVVFVARSDIPGRRLAHVVTTGMRLPAFSSASGRVLLAHRPIADVKKLLARTRIVRLTRRTIVNQAEILKAIAAVRRDGHAINREETEDGLIGIAVPLFNRAGLMVAALNASTSTTRADEARLLTEILPRLKATAGQLTSMLP
jgi:IclR family transcriptional regulator, pca regulon regulatory protein